MRIFQSALLLGMTVLIGCVAAQNARPGSTLEKAHQALDAAQLLESEHKIKHQATLIAKLLADTAGKPEVPDAFVRTSTGATALSSSEPYKPKGAHISVTSQVRASATF
jgi:hypothetical protein